MAPSAVDKFLNVSLTFREQACNSEEMLGFLEPCFLTLADTISLLKDVLLLCLCMSDVCV